MKKELQVLGAFNDKGVFEPTQFMVTKKIACHSLNDHLNLKDGYAKLSAKSCTEDQPSDTPSGYYICSAGKWVFVPYS